MVILQLTPDPHYPTSLKSEEPDFEKHSVNSTHQERAFMIEKLVETYANVINSIWNPKAYENTSTQVVPTHKFINEILKRSNATFSTVQVSLFYIFRVKKVIQYRLKERKGDLVGCGRRMFVASLMLASKYLHDTNQPNKNWAQLTGLSLNEINAAEMAFLSLIDHRLFVSKCTFETWYTQLNGHIQKSFKRERFDQKEFFNKRLRQ